MSEKDSAAPKKKGKLLLFLLGPVILLGGGGAGGYMLFASQKAEATPKAPEKGVVVTLEDPLTINLSAGHYLKLGFAMQMTADAGEEEIDTAEARDLAIDQYTGLDIAVLENEKGRAKAKQDLLAKLDQAYRKDKKQLVMDIYFTQFVTQ
ncbi:flagellar FliL protein [Krasilnikovia cinnamomea]|uniref:Flagellar protein FliL n=1 Tax=Krasilnikovia cinnamomea TaxID=349313 RepID=A0A4Q7ZI13_9ACTN|nr:flagellar basal body-associated FliL family protein [Krasilnikovia cinnamomea]RZU50467.1 flagellar FliL protein [Krasilnikovia cinnamomea]